MRLIASIPSRKEATEFSYFLQQEGIENECELNLSADGRDIVGQIWVVNEEDLDRALAFLEDFRKDPDNPRWRNIPVAPKEKKKERGSFLGSLDSGKKGPQGRQGMGRITLATLVICILLFLGTAFTDRSLTKLPPYLPYSYGIDSPIAQELMYDFPRQLALKAEILRLLTPQQLTEEEPPPELAPLVSLMQATPAWRGAYDEFLCHYAVGAKDGTAAAPLFEKLGEGEIWRLITPVLLHADIFHILFNMIWLIVLGNQIERRVGGWRSIILILVAGIISNTAQYLMGGPSFLGYSGIICAMAGFVWVRQRKAPWEGYLLHRATLFFIGIYVLGLFVLQLIAFFIAFGGGNWQLGTGIANTAHIVGGLTGIALGQLGFFAWKARK